MDIQAAAWKIKINMIYLHILDEFSLAGGGVRSVVADVSQEMAKRGLRVYICPLGIPQGHQEDEYIRWSQERGIEFCLLRKNGENLLKAAKRLKNLLKKLNGSDKCCTYLHLKRGVLTGIIASIWLNNVRRVEVYHSNYINYKLQAVVCRPFIHHYLPVSKESFNQLVDRYGVDSSKISLAYNGINIEEVRAKISDINRDKTIFRILSVGRMAPQKNLETAISAFCRFTKSEDYVNSEYLIAGDGPQRREFEELSEGKVKFLGMVERSSVCSNIAVADVVMFPSLWEGHSIALLEVLAIGCPVIVTDIPAFREVLGYDPLQENELYRPGPFGVVFHKGNVESCKAAISYMARHRTQYQDMRRFVMTLADKYTVSKQVDVYINAANF